MNKIIIVGGGAAGMFAAICAAQNGCEVHVYEKNEKVGKKLFITGKGRCNVTNACETQDEFLNHVVTNPRFMYSSLNTFDNHSMMRYLENAGLRLKTERGLRVFPASDKSSDVIKTLSEAMIQSGVRLHLNQAVQELCVEDDRVTGVMTADGRQHLADRVILATGGISYPSTGSTGDGHQMAKKTGHKVTELYPSLVPMVCREDWVKSLQGLSLKNIAFTLKQGKKTAHHDFGEMMFTHFGITGPVVLSGSAHLPKLLKKGEVIAVIDLKPALTEEQLDARLLRDLEENKNKQLRNALSGLLPARLLPVVLELAQIDPYQSVHDFDKKARRRLVMQLKNMSMTVEALRGFNEAIITQGGVSVKDIRPATMASKKLHGLYFAGELIDIDAYTGGFNLQLAWSTAYTAGHAAAAMEE